MKKSKQLLARGFEGIVLFLTVILRLLWSPFVGAWNECEADMNRRPSAKNWKEFVLFSLKSYFSPLIGAIAGVKKEFKRSFAKEPDAK